MIIIRLKKGETVDRALKRMKKILDKEGIMKQIRANRYFEKPSEKKRKKAARARIPPATLNSFIVFHSPQLGHLPTHFADSCPHSSQTYMILSFAIALS